MLVMLSVELLSGLNSPNYKYDYTCHPACHYNHPTTIRNIQENHINGNGWCVVCGVWCDIGYSFLMGGAGINGNVYEGDD